MAGVNNPAENSSLTTGCRLRAQLRMSLAVGFAALVLTIACHDGAAGSFPVLPTAILQTSDVENLIATAVTRAHLDKKMVIVAVCDREGNVLGVFDMIGAPMTSKRKDVDPVSKTFKIFPFMTWETERAAIAKARTAAFLSSDQNAFSTRTAFALVQVHFPFDIANTPEAPLFGLNFSSLPCGDIQKNGSGLTGGFGGIPVYLNGAIAGGIGVEGSTDDEDERIALSAVTNQYSVPASITADNIYINGIQLPWIGVTPPGHGHPIPYSMLIPAIGMPNMHFPYILTPPGSFPLATFAGVSGEIRFPIVDSTRSDPNKLTASDVMQLITNSIALMQKTRAAIRQPIGVPARMQVGVTDLDGQVLGVFRTNDATMFSLDIVVQKGRTVTEFSDPTQDLGKMLRQQLGEPMNSEIAFTSRTVGFLAQPFYPPGIDGTSPGPLVGLQKRLLLKDSTPTFCAPNGDGVTAFPGSTPLYRNGALIGGLGISGDGVDQDDYVTNAGAAEFLPPDAIRCDQITFRGTPLPFFKFPRQPGL